MTASLARMTRGVSQCSATASATGKTARKEKQKEFMERMRAAHPTNPQAGVLPARLRHTRNEPARSEFSEGQARNLEAANKSPAAAADLATINHPRRAGIARQLRQGQIIFLRFELSTERRVFFHGRALTFVAINPGRFRHKGTRKVASLNENANGFSRSGWTGGPSHSTLGV